MKLPVEEIRRQYRDQMGYTNQVTVHSKYSTKLGNVGPGNLGNDVLMYFDFGHCTNNWNRLIRRTSIFFMWFVRVLGEKGHGAHKLAENMAIMFWIRAAMPATNVAVSEGKLKNLNPQQHPKYPDVLVVIGRVTLYRFGDNYLPILMSGTRTAWLIMLWSHNQDHAGIDTTFQTSLQLAWIVGGRLLARSIKRSCVRRTVQIS